MNKFLFFALTLAAGLALALPAQARDWQVVPDGSRINFTTSFQGDAFTGQFSDFEARINYDPAALDQASFDVQVMLSSVDTNARQRDQVLRGKDFFATKSFPVAHFVTTDFERLADDSVVAHGTLKIRDVTRPVTLTVDFKPGADAATLEARTTLDRHAFNLGNSKDWDGISNQVEVRAQLQLK